MEKVIRNLIRIFLTVMTMVMTAGHMMAQEDDPDRDVTVYFQSGVHRLQKGNSRVAIPSQSIMRTVRHFRLDSISVWSAFPNFDESDTLQSVAGQGVNQDKVKIMNLSKVFKIRARDSQERQALIDSLRKLPEVLFAEPAVKAIPYAIPNDTYFGSQWGLKNGTTGRDIHAAEAWDIYKGSSNSIIGIIDGGVDANHSDLSGKISGDVGYGWQGHGIHVAGIASAKTNNSYGVSGVDWYAQIHAQRIDGLSDAGTYIAILDAVNYSPNVNVLNNSWGFTNGYYSTLVRSAFAYAYKQNRVSVVAMGNENTNYPVFPAGYGLGIIAVGATTSSDTKASFSNTGNHIDVVAPGVGIISTYTNGNYASMDGTSMATPFVSGIASLLKGYRSDLYNDDIENLIKLSANKVGSAPYDANGWNSQMGYGRVNAKAALDLLRTPYVLGHYTASGGTVVNVSSPYSIALFGVEGLPDGSYTVKCYEVQKTVTLPTNATANVWGTGVNTTGWEYTPEGYGQYGMGFCQVVNKTATTATLRTYVYELTNYSGQYLGYYPATPANVNFGYTVHRTLPLTVSIGGPDCVSKYSGSHTWSAQVSGGTGSYSYQWTSTVESGVIGTGSSITKSYGPGFTLYLTVTSGSETRTASLSVGECTGGGGCEFAVAPCLAKAEGKENLIPDQLELGQSYPNPANPSATINFALPEAANVTLKIYNIQGQEVRTLFGNFLSAGYYNANWDGKDDTGSQVASGTYIYRLQAGKFIQSKKLLLVK